MYWAVYISLALFLIKNSFYCMKIIPVLPRITYVNEQYAENVSATVRRYSRRSDYVLNLKFTTKAYFGNNVTLQMNFFEYLHNEYRPSFIEMHFKACDLVLTDPYLSGIIQKGGITTCPLPPGTYQLQNMTFNKEIPSVWPFEKGRTELIVKLTPKGDIIAKGDLVLTFVQKLKTRL